MKNSKSIGWIILIVVVLLLGFNGCSTYNSLVEQNANVDQAWGNVQNQYQRRFDLIPNLVETVKGYARHEQETLENVTNARAGVTKAADALDSAMANAKAAVTNEADPSAQSMERFMQAQDQLNKQFSIYVNAVHEAYPDLKANENFKDLQVQLEGTENRIATERTNYNAVVKEYNIKVKRFPGNIWAGIFGFEGKPMFAAESEAQSAPRVSF